jgi:V/A-type H+-transporting ATPase subunit I
MVFGPTPMRRLYLAVPTECEDRVIEKIGQMGSVQLIREFQVKRAEKSRVLEVNTRFERLNERLEVLLSRDLAGKLPPAGMENPLEVNCESTERLLTQDEEELNDLTSALERLEREVKELVIVEEKLGFMIAAGLRTDEVGSFRHMFVKLGFIRSNLTIKLATYVSGTSVVSIVLPKGKPRQSLVVVAGLNDDRDFAEETLKLLNFEEITLPQGLNGDPKVALGEIEVQKKAREGEIKRIKERLLDMRTRSSSISPCVNEAVRFEEAKELVLRTKTRSLIHGWIPYDKVEALERQVEEVVPKEDIFLKVEEPKPEDSVPVQFKSRGVLRAFELFTSLQGVPNYFEVNPTPIYTLLYVVMFGIMFGDVGAGIVLIILGVLMTRLRGGLFAFSLNATKQIARILAACGLLSVVFGFVYGEFFLVRTPWPGLLNPLTNIEEIIVIALAFGVAQIILSLILNIANMTRRREPLKVILGERGAVGLAFYLSGVVVAYAFIRQRNLDVFFQGDTAIFSSIALVSLALVFLSPLIESLLRKESAPVSRKLLEGFGVGLESFIAFIANSVSYIRLAAFAIAHEAIGLAAIVLGAVLGSILSLVLLNVLDFAVEGFASFIQSLRLMYYEFSTRFFLKDGIPYEPFKIGGVRMKI